MPCSITSIFMELCISIFIYTCTNGTHTIDRTLSVFCFAFTLFTLFLWVSENPLKRRPVENLSQKVTFQNIAEAKPDCNDCLFIMHLNNDVLG